MTKKVQSPDSQLRQYMMLVELSKAIASHGSLDELFKELDVRLRQLLDFHSLGLILHDPARNIMRLHLSQTTEPAMEQLPEEMPVEKSVAGWVWQNQIPMIIHDVETETRFDLAVLRDRYPVRSLCVIPLTT
ncbi:MAG: Fis family transcriptional regulator, partial [Blastocatellia bacterium]